MQLWNPADMPKTILIREVGMRDGLQQEKFVVPTNQKIDLINSLNLTGLQAIEVTSFVHPDFVPQLSDAEQVLRGIQRKDSVSYEALVPNEKGLVRAQDTDVDEVIFVVSASDEHNLANVKQTRKQSLLALEKIAEKKKDCKVKVTVGTAFGCPFVGEVSYEWVYEIIKTSWELGVHEVFLADTTGMANPRSVYERVSQVRLDFPEISLGLHFHDTRGMGLSNVLAGLQAGVSVYDSSLGGIGGCPFAPGATGNIATEDLVHMVEEMGIHTGVNLPELLKVSKKLQDILGRELPGHILKAGPAFPGSHEKDQRELS